MYIQLAVSVILCDKQRFEVTSEEVEKMLKCLA